MTTFWYSVNSETRYKVSSVFTNWRDRAADAAEDYHDAHDGWEDTWPLEVELYDSEDGPAVARYTVSREMTPQFYVERAS